MATTPLGPRAPMKHDRPPFRPGKRFDTALPGVGLALGFIAVSIAALAGVPPQLAGVASGLLTTSQQIGGAVGTAMVSSISLSRADHLLHIGRAPGAAYTSGYALAFWVLAGIGAAGLVLSWVLVRPETAAVPTEKPATELA